MRLVLLILWFSTFHLGVQAQQWEEVGNAPLGFVYGMSAGENNMYVSVQISGEEIPNQVHVFDGGTWNHLADTVFGNGSNPIRGLCIYQDTPYCYHFGEITNRGIHMYDGTHWQLIGETPHGGVNGMKVYDDTLYIFGQFREINGDTNLRQIVKYDGETFMPAAAPLHYFPTTSPVVKDIHFYQDELYAVGDIKTSTGKYHISRWDGLQWNDVGDGFPYSSYPRKLMEYSGYLLINEHPVSYSGTVNGLVAWDGQQFLGMGQIACEHPAGVSHMTVHNGKLWVAGDCSEPLPGFHHYFASYDGERWCEYDFVEKAQHMTVFQDRMYAYLLDHPNGPVHRFVRWLDETEPDWCGETIHLGVGDVEADAGEITIYPNPTTSTTTLTWQNQTHGNYQLHVYDVHGRQITPPVIPLGEGKLQIDMAGLAKGIYIGRLNSENHSFSFKWIKQ